MAKPSQSQSIKELQIEQQPVRSAGPRSGPPPQYIDLDRLKNADGLIAIISQRLSNRVMTFAIFKEFERDKRVERTSFIAQSLGDSYLSIAKLAVERMEEITSKPSLMADLQREALQKLEPDDRDHAARVIGLRR